MTDFLIGRDRSIRYGDSGMEEPQAPVNPVKDNPQVTDKDAPNTKAPDKKDTLFDTEYNTEDKAVEPTLVTQDTSSPSGGTDAKAEKEKPSNTKKAASTKKKSPSKGTTSKTKK